MKTIYSIKYNTIAVFAMLSFAFFSLNIKAQIEVIASGGKVGIGTASPSAKLDVESSAAASITVRGKSTATSGTCYGGWFEAKGSGAGTNVGIYAESGAGTTNFNCYLANLSASANNWSIYSAAPAKSYFAGDMGIGTTAPGRKFVVSNSGAEGTEIHPFTGYTQIISYKRSTSAYIPLVLQDASGGYVGVGTTTPVAKFTINGGQSNTAGISVKSGDVDLLLTEDVATNEGKIQVMSGGTSSTIGAGTYRLTLQPQGGNVGIGMTGAGYQLQLSTNSAGKPTSSTWTITSDSRTKTNVESYGHGLDLVRQVKLVTYQYNGVANTPAGENGVGVVAQDFQQVFPNSVKPFTVIDTAGANESYFGVDLHELFIANVGAVQQLDSVVTAQNAIISKQDSVNTALQEQLTKLLDRINSCCTVGENRSTLTNASYVNQTDIKLTDAQTIVLEQNVPNPFAEQTSINYYLPDNTKKAQLLFYNSQGRLIQSTDLVQKGKGTVNVFASDLSNGIYTYTLVVDGKVIETKKMVKQ